MLRSAVRASRVSAASRRAAAANLRFVRSSRDFRPLPRDAVSGLLRLSREAHKIPAFPARTPQTLRNATSTQGTQRGGEAHIDSQRSACLFQSCTCCSKFRMRSSISLIRSALFLYSASQRSATLSISFRQLPNFWAAGAHLRCRLWTVLTWRIQFHDLSNVVPQCLHQ